MPQSPLRSVQRPSLAEVMRLVSERCRERQGEEPVSEGGFELVPPIPREEERVVARVIQEEIDFEEYLRRKKRQ